MSWGSAQAFFHMGGYGLYVWGSYAVAALVIIAELFTLRQRQRGAREQAKRSRKHQSSEE